MNFNDESRKSRFSPSRIGLYIVLGVVAVALAIWGLFAAGILSEMTFVSWGVSKEANNFNVVRELTVYNNVTGEVIMVSQGRMSVVVDAGESQLEIMVANPGEVYEKHLVGLNETITYMVRDLSGVDDVENFEYRTVINPKLLADFDKNGELVESS